MSNLAFDQSIQVSTSIITNSINNQRLTRENNDQLNPCNRLHQRINELKIGRIDQLIKSSKNLKLITLMPNTQLRN